MRIAIRCTVALATCFVGLSASAAPATQPADMLALPGEIEAVTVYRGQALVTRLVELPGPAGLREFAVTDLPANVIGASIHAESADGVEVRSVLYRVRSLEHDVRAEVRQLDEQIRAAQDRLAETQKMLELIGQTRGYLEKLEQFVAPTATTELSKGVLNAETLEKLTAMFIERREQAVRKELDLNLAARDLNEQLQLLERKKQELASSSAKSAREAVVFANLRDNGGLLRLRYLVSDANWSPSYNVRAEAGQERVLVEVDASVQQMSGEDWTDVSMTLSTATPSLVAKAPSLTPMTISLVPSNVQQQAAQAGDYKQVRRELLAKQTEVSNFRNTGVPTPGQKIEAAGSPFDVNDLELNRLANEIQNLDLLAQGRVVREAAKLARIEDVSVTYALAGRISLPSRTDRQLIQVASLPLSGEFYKVATPLLTPYVYDEAAVANTGDIVLLAGPVSTYMSGQFVGHSEIPTVSIGESFSVGLGVDSSLRAGRELAEKTETVQGGNRVVDLTYRLSVENFGGKPAKVRLYDRMPQTTRQDIKLSLVSSGQDLSDDARYRQAEHKKNILRWEIDVPAKAIGPQAKTLEYQFRLEYDKQMSVAGLALAQ